MYATSLLSQIQSNVLQRTTLLLSKLYAWINELDGRGMHEPILKNKLLISDRKDANPFTERIGLEV